MPYCPTRDEVYQTLLSLLPPGLAWQSDDAAGDRSESVIRRYMYGLSKPFWDIEVALCESFDEMFVATATADMDEWLEDYGLPDESDPLGVTLAPRIRARDSTDVSNYLEIAEALGWSTQIRWLTGSDPEFPGVVATLYVLTDISTSPAAGEILDFGNWELPDSALGVPTPVPLISLLDKLIPAECAILSATWESAAPPDATDNEWLMIFP